MLVVGRRPRRDGQGRWRCVEAGAEIDDRRARAHARAARAGGGGEDLASSARSFEAGDLGGAWLVVAAATPEVNRVVAAAAESRRLFVLAVDDPSAASAYGAGTLRRGGVTVAVSTDGRAPALAGLLREGLEAVLPDELETLDRRGRAPARGWRVAGVPMAERRPLLLRRAEPPLRPERDD